MAEDSQAYTGPRPAPRHLFWTEVRGLLKTKDLLRHWGWPATDSHRVVRETHLSQADVEQLDSSTHWTLFYRCTMDHVQFTGKALLVECKWSYLVAMDQKAQIELWTFDPRLEGYIHSASMLRGGTIRCFYHDMDLFSPRPRIRPLLILDRVYIDDTLVLNQCRLGDVILQNGSVVLADVRFPHSGLVMVRTGSAAGVPSRFLGRKIENGCVMYNDSEFTRIPSRVSGWRSLFSYLPWCK